MFHGQGAPGIWWPCYSHSYALHCCEPRICHQFTLVILQVFAGFCPCYVYIYTYLYIRINIYKIKGLLIGSIGHYKDPYEHISIMDCHKGFDRWMTWPEIPDCCEVFRPNTLFFWVGNPEWLYILASSNTILNHYPDYGLKRLRIVMFSADYGLDL